MKDTKSKRAPGIGYGGRFKGMLNATVYTPSPLQYNIQSEFNTQPKSRAYSFGLSREHFRKVYIKENPPHDMSVPGPGQYQVNMSYTEQSPRKFSLRPKTVLDSSFQNFTKFVPGPGAYNNEISNKPNGFVYNAKYKSSGGIVISKSGQRFDLSKLRMSMAIPGPGNYDQKLQLDSKGNYTYYRYKNSGAPVFSRANRLVDLETSVTRKITPGPGTYRVQTEFGFYDPNESVNQIYVSNNTRNSGTRTESRQQ